MGFPHEAMVDMTGGVTEVFSIASLPRNLLEFLDHLLAKGALINCANSNVRVRLLEALTLRFVWNESSVLSCRNVRGCFPQGVMETMNGLGILFRHAYALTAVEKVITPLNTLQKSHHALHLTGFLLLR